MIWGYHYFLETPIIFWCCFSQIGCASRMLKQLSLWPPKSKEKSRFLASFTKLWPLLLLYQDKGNSFQHPIHLLSHFYLETLQKRWHIHSSKPSARRVDGKGTQEIAPKRPTPTTSKVQTAPTLPLRQKTNGTPTNGSCRNSVKEAEPKVQSQRPSSKGAVVRMKSAPRILGKGWESERCLVFSLLLLLLLFLFLFFLLWLFLLLWLVLLIGSGHITICNRSCGLAEEFWVELPRRPWRTKRTKGNQMARRFRIKNAVAVRQKKFVADLWSWKT